MKVSYLILGFLMLTLGLKAQDNIFLDRDFWKSDPDIEEIKAQIEKGNDPTQLNSHRFDATVYALLENADLKVIKYLLSQPGNTVDKMTHDGRNYLLWSGYGGNLETIDYLIQAGSDVNHVDEHGYGLVTFTAVGGQTNPAIYQLYKKNGLDLKDTNRSGANALLLAATNVDGLDELSFFLDNGLSLKDEDDKGNHIFLYAVSKGKVPFLKELVQAGVDYNKVNKDGENAVLLAARGARRHTNGVEVFEYLKSLNLDFNQTNNNGETALHYVAYNNANQNVFEYLMEQGVSPTALDKNGNPAIFNAIAYQNEKATSVLWPYITNYNYENNQGESFLTKAIEGANAAATDKLLEKGVNLQHRSADNGSYVDLLFQNYKESNKEYFKKYLPIFIKRGVQPNVNKENGYNVYHIAVEKNSPYLLEKSIEISNQINVKNTKGLTPLQEAALKAKDVKILKALVEAGADTSVTTEFNETVYALARENEALTNTNLEFLK